MTDELFTIEDAPAPSGPAPQIVDRSTAERWAECPAMAWHVENGRVSTSSLPADAGNEVHKILAAAVKARHMDAARPNELREMIDAAAAQSRSDVQPEVVTALRKCWPIVQLICTHEDNGEIRSPDDLIRYDGGDGAHAGQIAADLEIDGVKVRLTCEVDLLLATRSAKAVDLYDWKAGRTHWTATDVFGSFQFQFYSYITLVNYPTVDTVSVSVFMPREGSATDPIDFKRRDMFAWENRIKSAVRLLLKWQSASGPTHVPAWPAPEKCSICPAAAKCPLAHQPAAEVAIDPEAALKQLVALDAAADALRRQLTGVVRKLGRDLVFGDLAFGTEKPREKAKRAETCSVYEPPRVNPPAPGMYELGKAIGVTK